MAPMKRERCRFSMTVFGKSVYAFGGVSETPLVQVQENDEDQFDEDDHEVGGSAFLNNAFGTTNQWLPAGFCNLKLVEWECLRRIGEVRHRSGLVDDGGGVPRRRPQPPLAARLGAVPERHPRLRRARRRAARPRTRFGE